MAWGSEEPELGGPGDDVAPLADPELVANVVEMGLDGAVADEEPRGDLLQGQILGEQAQDVQLARRSDPRRTSCPAVSSRGGPRGRRRGRGSAPPPAACRSADLVQQGRGLVGHPRDEAQLRQGQERQRPLEGRVASRRPARARPSGAPRPRHRLGRGLDLAEEAVGGQADEGLGWRGRERQGLVRGGAGTVGVAGRPVIARPGHPPVGLTEDAPAPGEPAVVRLQPGPRCLTDRPRRGRGRPRGAGGKALPGG